MDVSTSLIVNVEGLHLYAYDSRLREEITTKVYGVHQTMWPTKIFIWNTTRGEVRNADENWLRTEDGMQFQEEIGKEVLSMEFTLYDCLMCGAETDNADHICDNCKDTHR